MMNRAAIGLLAIGLAFSLTSLRSSIQEINIGGLWIETGLWCIGLVVLLVACARENTNVPSQKISADPTAYLHWILIPAIAALLWGLYTEGPVWSLFGWCLGILSLIGMCFRLTPKRMVHLSLFSFLIPFSLWPFASELQLVGQSIATYLAGSILDVFKVFFFTRGNILGLVSNEFLQIQQCSGLRLFVPILIAVFTYGFARNYSLVRSFFLLLAGAFFGVVFNAVRIAYLAWWQDGQSVRLETNEWMLDALGIATVFFLTWSADQFFAAFSERQVDPDKDDGLLNVVASDVGVTSEASCSKSNPSALTFICLAAMVAVGVCQFYRSLVDPPARFSVQELGAAIGQLKFDTAIDGWSLEESGQNDETLTPVSRQSLYWPERQWELNGSSAQPVSMRFRIDGIWFRPPRLDWLWRWFGWQTEVPIRDQQGNVGWGMSRSIVEEGFVVSRYVGVLGDSVRGQPLVQVSLVQQGYIAIPEAQRNQQRLLFDKLRESLQEQLRVRMSGQAGGREGP